MSQHPEKLFILLTQPPLNPAETDPEQAHRARTLASWLASDEFKGNLPNLFVFDLFDRLAVEDVSIPEANTLRLEFRNGEEFAPQHPGECGACARSGSIYRAGGCRVPVGVYL